MKSLILAITAAIAVSTGIYLMTQPTTTNRLLKVNDVPTPVYDSWQHWKQANGKTYGTDNEEAYRLQVFYNNFKTVSSANSSQSDYTLGLNKFADLTSNEFQKQYTGFQASGLLNKVRNDRKLSTENLRSTVDWVAEGAVTDVKDQGQCGSCWSFSTTGSCEGAYWKAHGTLKSFSEQELVDCSSNNNGCNGGLMDRAFSWIRSNGGLVEEKNYAYRARQGSCRFDSSQAVFQLSTYHDVPQYDNDQLAAALNQQPVAVAIDANNVQLYTGGIFSNCGTSLDHGVLAVGYGTENGRDYWKVKNSWGGNWGEQGYFRLAKTSGFGAGTCGIALSASYPTAE